MTDHRKEGSNGPAGHSPCPHTPKPQLKAMPEYLHVSTRRLLAVFCTRLLSYLVHREPAVHVCTEMIGSRDADL